MPPLIETLDTAFVGSNIANLAAYLGSGLAMGLGAIGSGWGIGYTATGCLRGMVRQPSFPSTFRNMLIGQAMTETPSIFALVISIMLFNLGGSGELVAPDSLAQAVAFIAAGLCMGLGAVGSGAGSGIVAVDSLEVIARTPKTQNDTMLMMLVGQAWCQTPSIFAFVVALLLCGDIGGIAEFSSPQIVMAIGKYLGMGICMGAGAIGSAIGIAFVSAKVCRGMAECPEGKESIRRTLFVGAAVAESPTVFALIIAILLYIAKVDATSTGEAIIECAGFLGAGIAMGFGALGSGMGEGFVAGKACEGISRRPEEYTPIFRTMLVGMAVSESTAIYSLVIALMLIK